MAGQACCAGAALDGIQRTGYSGFGSFMVETSVQDLVLQDPASYIPPSVPFTDPASDGDAGVDFGIAARRHFIVDFDTWTFINHGAFGAVSAPVQRSAELWRQHCERQPLRFLDRELFPHLVRVTREMAAYIGAEPQDLVFVPNATTGLNTVISSASPTAGAVLFSLDLGYGSVKKMLAEAAKRSGAHVVTAPVPLPLLGPEQIIKVVEDHLPAGAALAVFDAVTSNTAVVLPLEQLIAVCKARGVPVLIDGAHALGMMPLDMKQLQPDYFVSNCHKWLCGARGSAILWVHPSRQASIRPLVISHGTGHGFTSDFIWDGCRDYAPVLAVSTALRWWEQLGPAAARDYMHRLLEDAVELLCRRWSTGTFAPISMCGTMALVQLPAGIDSGRGAAAAAAGEGSDASGSTYCSADAKYVQDVLHFNHHIEVPVKLLASNLYVRISVHIYNILRDYEQLAVAVESMVLSQSMAV